MQLKSPKPYLPKIMAGFPSPAEDFTELSISLDQALVTNPPATFMAYAEGESMIDIGIHHGDIIIIDRSLSAENGDIIVAFWNGEFLIKEYSKIDNQIKLIPHNSKYPIIYINEDTDFQVWGVVVHSIRSFR
ncbi:MAG: translesion error-prone DNA polymerase V autoproteolytic subunit [Candidatus Marinimicrobia bacterium]|nr:translesion error-prone DNA polymerase V autoproteolytic subunit [Candidatus Neomarinimicrobiota bacterium]